MTESTIQCLIGGVSGTLIAAALLYFGRFSMGAEEAMIAVHPSAELTISGTVVSVMVGVFAT